MDNRHIYGIYAIRGMQKTMTQKRETLKNGVCLFPNSPSLERVKLRAEMDGNKARALDVTVNGLDGEWTASIHESHVFVRTVEGRKLGIHTRTGKICEYSEATGKYEDVRA